jgi:hypothetical protein
MVLAVTKANLTSIPASLFYRVVDREGTGAIQWDGPSKHTATDLLAVRDGHPDGGSPARDEAIMFLEDLLADGPVHVTEVRAAARQAGIAPRTIDRAKTRLGIIAKKLGRPGESDQRWQWSLPEKPRQAPAPNENAWLLGLVAVRERRLTTQRGVGLVGARGVDPAEPTSSAGCALSPLPGWNPSQARSDLEGKARNSVRSLAVQRAEAGRPPSAPGLRHVARRGRAANSRPPSAAASMRDCAIRHGAGCSVL